MTAIAISAALPTTVSADLEDDDLRVRPAISSPTAQRRALLAGFRAYGVSSPAAQRRSRDFYFGRTLPAPEPTLAPDAQRRRLEAGFLNLGAGVGPAVAQARTNDHWTRERV